jgi:carboxypeptidase Taq
MADQEKYSYDRLVRLSRKTHLLKSIALLLGWDQEIYMPKGVAEVRAESLQLLARLIHKEEINPEFKQALASQIDLESGQILNSILSDEDKANVREMRRDFLNQVKLPQEFVEKFAAVTSAAHHSWIDARERNYYPIFQPHFEKIVELNQQQADYRDIMTTLMMP